MFQINNNRYYKFDFVISYPSFMGWPPIGLIDFIIAVTLLVEKQKYRFTHIPELSSEANELLQRYGHYFAMPFASKDFSASAATSQFAGVIIAIIGLWWAALLGVANWCLMGIIACSLSPVSLLAEKPELRIVHDEVIGFLQQQFKKQK
ncbi:MAG: hypothetical protein LWW94_02395 [Candidatus Desulfofervidaceae bacterium]|nr:hypothetical protein [Candidatus Desulfofervidaceae bacterium]